MKKFETKKVLRDNNEMIVFIDENGNEFNSSTILQTKISDVGIKEFYMPPNLNNPEGDYKFTDRIGDMVTAIRDGIADDIFYTGFFSDNFIESAITYLDRDFGEKIREMNINKYKNSKFGWTIMHRNGEYITKKLKYTIHSTDPDRFLFKSKEEANLKINEIVSYMKTKFKSTNNLDSIVVDLDDLFYKFVYKFLIPVQIII